MEIVGHFRAVTPVFCAGADQNGEAEVRSFSIRGCLRWFFRALDGRCDLATEGKVFGGPGGDEEGQASPFVVRVEGDIFGNEVYDHLLNPKRGKQDGACYLGYSLYLGENIRKALPPGSQFSVKLSPRWAMPGPQVCRAWLSSLWLFGHLGGLGSRMRRGFGTVALEKLEIEGWDEKAKLPLPNLETTKEAWREKFNEGYNIITKWFPKRRSEDSDQPVLTQPLEILIGPACRDWLSALRHIGTLMRTFRHTGKKYPRNAAFGLPLLSSTFKDEIVPARDEFNRAPSRLWIRVLELGDKSYPMVWLLKGNLLPKGTGLAWRKGSGKPANLSLPSEGHPVLQEFLSFLKQNGYG